MMDGWIKLHRSLLQWEWYSDIPAKTLFIHLLLSANHADANFRGRKVARGQRWTSIAHLANETGLTIKQVRAAIEKLQRTNELTSEGASNGTMITVCKYDSYQEIPKQKGKPKGEQRANKGQATGQTKGNKQEEEEGLEEEQEEREDSEALPPLPDHSLITWIKKHTPRVHKMNKPLTNEEAERLIADLDIGKNERGEMLKGILMNMENYAPLLSKSVSANLTIRKWWKMEEERKANGKPKQAEETFVPRTEIYYK
jgi:hypothetical protein